MLLWSAPCACHLCLSAVTASITRKRYMLQISHQGSQRGAHRMQTIYPAAHAMLSAAGSTSEPCASSAAPPRSPSCPLAGGVRGTWRGGPQPRQRRSAGRTRTTPRGKRGSRAPRLVSEDQALQGCQQARSRPPEPNQQVRVRTFVGFWSVIWCSQPCHSGGTVEGSCVR